MSHGGTERTEGYQSKAMEVTEALSVHRATELVCTLFQLLYAQSIYPKSYQESVGYTSVALCAVSTSVTLCVTSVASVTPCAYYPIFRKNLQYSLLVQIGSDTMPLTRRDGSVICLPIGLLIYLDVMIKPIWKNILHILVTVLTALATTLGVSSCM